MSFGAIITHGAHHEAKKSRTTTFSLSVPIASSSSVCIKTTRDQSWCPCFTWFNKSAFFLVWQLSYLCKTSIVTMYCIFNLLWIKIYVYISGRFRAREVRTGVHPLSLGNKFSYSRLPSMNHFIDKSCVVFTEKLRTRNNWQLIAVDVTK